MLTASQDSLEAMREMLLDVPIVDKWEMAHRASMRLREADAEGRLDGPLLQEIGDAIALLLALGISVVHE